MVLILKMQLPSKFNHEKQELYFGFNMNTKSLRFQQAGDEINMNTPVLINCGRAVVKSKEDEKAKEAQLRASQQSSSQQQQRRPQ